MPEVTNKVKVAFVGIGGFANLTLDDVFTSLDAGRDDFEIVGAVDPFAKGSKHYARISEAGIPIYDTIEELYDGLWKKENIIPDLCVISTPIEFHTHQICYAMSHKSSVLCEKPLTGEIGDLFMLEQSKKVCAGFIAIGYQWSYSDAIQSLKKDIMDGVYGKALEMKSLVLWPRDKAYFKRSTGWAGKICGSDGRKVLDSVVNNATAHYIHNILYVLGKDVDGCAGVTDMEASLLRLNEIETFDTATVRFTLEGGTKGIYAVSHSTDKNYEPCFEYTFEKGKVTFSDEQGRILGKLSDGRVIDYGDPFAERTKKFFTCVDLIKSGSRDVPCGVSAAAGEVCFVTKLHAENRIFDVKKSAKCEKDGLLYVDGLYDAMLECYNEGKILSETSLWEKAAEL